MDEGSSRPFFLWILSRASLCPQAPGVIWWPGDRSGFDKIRSWAVDVLSLSDAITASIVHAFYALKIWFLVKYPYNYIWAGVVLVLSFCQASTRCTCCLQGISYDKFFTFQRFSGTGDAAFEVAIHNNI